MRYQPPSPHPSAQSLSKASQAPADAKPFEETKNLKMDTLRLCVKNVNLALQMQSHAAENKLRAERKVGAALAAIQFHGGNRRSSSGGENFRLADLGVDHNKSARWQREAAVPEEEFERYLRESMATNKAISVTGLLHAGKTRGPTNGNRTKRTSRAVTVVVQRYANGAVSALPNLTTARPANSCASYATIATCWNACWIRFWLTGCRDCVAKSEYTPITS